MHIIAYVSRICMSLIAAFVLTIFVTRKGTLYFKLEILIYYQHRTYLELRTHLSVMNAIYSSDFDSPKPHIISVLVKPRVG